MYRKQQKFISNSTGLSYTKRSKDYYYNKIQEFAKIHDWKFQRNPSGSSKASLEFQISNGRSKLCGVIKDSNSESIWVGVDDKLVRFMKSSPENLLVIKVDHVWNKLIVLPYSFLQPFARRVEWLYHDKRGIYVQWEFVIVRRSGKYYIKQQRGPSLNEYVMNLDSMLDLVRRKMENLAALMTIRNDNDFVDKLKQLTKRDQTFIDELIHESDIEARKPKRVWTRVQIIKRNNRLREMLKIRQGFKCQICGFTFRKKDGSYYVEEAHIQPLSDQGLDTSDNVLVLCANHHRMLDLAKVQIISRSKDSIEFLINDQRYRAKF